MKRTRIATRDAVRRLKLFERDIHALCARHGFTLKAQDDHVAIMDRFAEADPDWPAIAFFAYVDSASRLRIKPEYKELEP